MKTDKLIRIYLYLINAQHMSSLLAVLCGERWITTIITVSFPQGLPYPSYWVVAILGAKMLLVITQILDHITDARCCCLLRLRRFPSQQHWTKVHWPKATINQVRKLIVVIIQITNILIPINILKLAIDSKLTVTRLPSQLHEICPCFRENASAYE